jgi:hypothetical protein
MFMRVLTLAFLLLAASHNPATAQWKEYVYAAEGFAIQFPAPPRIARGMYTSERFGQLPATIYSVEHENILYTLTVVPYARVEEGVNLVGEAGYNVMREGTILFHDIPRIGTGNIGVFGICMVVDMPDGRRKRSTAWFNRGRLYQAEATVLPARGDKDMAVPSRFDQTLRFDVGPG